MHLPELDIQLSAFCSDMHMPGESLVQMKAKIFNLGGNWHGRIVKCSGWACVLAGRKCDLYGFGLALTSPTGGGRSVGIVRSRTKATEFSLVLV
jgi:hypothetical protein